MNHYTAKQVRCALDLYRRGLSGPEVERLSGVGRSSVLYYARQAGISRQSLGTSVLAGEITSAIEGPIYRSTGLDVFRLEASESGQLSKVAVGKEVTDRLTLEFQSDFAPETAQRALQANYYLTDNILLKGRRVWESSQSDTTPHYNLNMSFRVRMY